MLTREENELLTRVGRGTPCGELLRRYWHPVAAAGEFTEEKPIQPVKNLEEELVAYRVETLGGLIFAYLGPEPKPLLPRWDVLVWENGKRWIVKESIIDCNWLQPMENSVDPAHLFWLHGDTAHLTPRVKKYAEEHEFIRFEFGIKKRRTSLPVATGEAPLVDEHPLLFPTTLRHVAPYENDRAHRHNLQIRVPVDDSHTQVFRVNFVPSNLEKSPPQMQVPFRYSQLKTGPRQYDMRMVSAQDSMAWETQGAIADRTEERLGIGDEGIILLRKLLKEQIEVVQQGLDPIGVIRDPQKNRIIELNVTNERIGLHRPQSSEQDQRAVAS